jgi:hypothetical protein
MVFQFLEYLNLFFNSFSSSMGFWSLTMIEVLNMTNYDSSLISSLKRVSSHY